MKKNLLKNSGVQALLAALICVILGLFIGFVVLLFINPAGAGEAILTVIKNFLTSLFLFSNIFRNFFY